MSEHIAWVRAGSHEVGHLTELPMTREATGCPILLDVGLHSPLPR